MSAKTAVKPSKKGPSPMVKTYLVAYNLLSTFGWGIVAFTTYSAIFAGLTTGSFASPAELFKSISPVLQIVQTAALLEVVHSALKIVPSAVFTTFVQVMSRIIVLWGYTVPLSYSHWSLYLLVASWSTVEIPRYLFYVWQLLFPEAAAPYPLFFLRYSLFAVLYPTGITGEILQIAHSIPHYGLTFPAVRIASYLILLVLYPPGSPFMYMHMVKLRKAQFKKRQAASDAAKGIKPAVKPAEGLIFPVDPATGVASTSDLGKRTLAAATKAASPAAAEKVLSERNWRFGYGKHFVEHTRLAAANKKQALAMAQAGLDYCYDNFEFVRGDFKGSLKQALTHFKDTFIEGKLIGSGAAKPTLAISYQGQELTGAALKTQLDEWVSYGTIEPSCRTSILWADTHKLDLSDKWFVLLGAGAAMGPLQILLSLGANIVALDLDRAPVWQRILGMVEKSASTVIFPMKTQPKDQSISALAEVAGCNLFTHTPEAATFVANVVPNKQLVIGSYAYLDSAAHVQVSLAMDAVIAAALAKRGNAGVALGYLCSPTDVFTVDEATHRAAKANLANAPAWQKVLAATGPLAKNGIAAKDDEGKDVFINDGIVVDQGPNYAWAKRIQHWRAIIAFSNGSTVSTNLAPSTATLSVVSNASFAAAYGGMYLFKPMEVMRPELSNSAMAALMLHDVCNPDAAKNPKSTLGAEIVEHPMMLFAAGALHGGVWRLGFKMNSIGVVAASVFYLKKFWYAPAALVGAVGALASGIIQLP